MLLDKALKDCRSCSPPGGYGSSTGTSGVPGSSHARDPTHVLIRVKDGITLRPAGEFLPDGSSPAEISGGGDTLTVRVTECTVTVAGHDAPGAALPDR